MARQPARAAPLLAGSAQLDELLRIEMTAGIVLHSGSLNDGQLPVLKQGMQRSCGRVQAKLSAQIECCTGAGRGNLEDRTGLLVGTTVRSIGRRHKTQSIDTTSQENIEQNVLLLAAAAGAEYQMTQPGARHGCDSSRAAHQKLTSRGLQKCHVAGQKIFIRSTPVKLG